MKCAHCGKPLAQGGRFCPYCGKEIGTPSAAQEALIGRAKAGDTEALSALYEQTYSKVYYTVKSMIRNEDDALDVVQDAYVKAFTHLDRFEGNFLPWVRQIAANAARDWLKRKKAALFSDLAAGEEQDTPAEETLADERSASLPQEVLDQGETARLLREILDGLPEDQRAVIGMYYYEELSVKEIAASLGASESAVKSRLLYGRRKIEKQVRELEKRGTKLYGLAPLPFLLFLLHSQDAYAAALPAEQLLHGVLQVVQSVGTAAAGAASEAGAASGTAAAEAASGAGAAPGTAAAGAGSGAGAASGTAAAGAGSGAGAASGTAAAAAGGLAAWKIAVLAVAAFAVVGGGILAGTVLSQPPENEPAAVVQDVSDGAESAVSGKPASAAQAAASSEAEPSSAQEEPQADPVERALASYRELVPTADTLYYGYDKTPTGVYRYALCRLNAEDEFPSIVLEQQAETLEYHMIVYRWNEETGEAAQVAGLTDDGETRGGLRTGLSQMADGDGLRYTVVYTATGETEITRLTQSEQDPRVLSFKDKWSGGFTDPVPASLAFYDLVWYDVSDLSGLESWSWPPASQPVTGSSPQSAAPPAAPSAAPAEDGGRIVFTGTIDTYTHDEVVDLQGQPDPNAPWSDTSATYRLIVLDAPQTMELTSVDGTRSGEVRFLNVTNASGLDGLDGQHLTFSIDASSTWWPSDTSMPLGQPSTKDVHVLG